MWLRKTLKWLGIVSGTLLGLALVVAFGAYIHVGNYFQKKFDIAGASIDVPQGQPFIDEGARLAKLRGCNGGCHGEGSRGQIFFELPGGSKVAAPNIVRVAQEYPVEDFERIVRHGVRPDGTSVLMAMPSSMFHNLTDEDLGAIVSFLRSRDPGDQPSPKTHINAIGRLMMAFYKIEFGPLLSAELVSHAADRIDHSSPSSEQFGEYLAMTVCTECHGDDLRGSIGPGAPDLIVTTAYPLEDFRALMREGTALGGRELGLMARVAMSRFAYFTDDEIDSLHRYLQSLPDQRALEASRGKTRAP